MRIVSKAELLKMPKGTPFAQYYGRSAGWPESFDILVCPSTVTDDFYYRSIDQPDNDGTEQMIERQDDMAMNGTSYPVDVAIGRDGLFDADARYLVWEPDDVRRIINLLQGGDDERDNE